MAISLINVKCFFWPFGIFIAHKSFLSLTQVKLDLHNFCAFLFMQQPQNRTQMDLTGFLKIGRSAETFLLLVTESLPLQKYYYPDNVSGSWLFSRLEGLSNLLVIFTALLAVINRVARSL